MHVRTNAFQLLILVFRNSEYLARSRISRFLPFQQLYMAVAPGRTTFYEFHFKTSRYKSGFKGEGAAVSRLLP